MGLELNYYNGQTPLDEDEKDGLLVKTITTRSELDEFEQLNIEEAKVWLLKTAFTVDKIISDAFIIELHKRMFNKVWRWAGSYRKSNKNIGVDKFEIPMQLRLLLDDTKYWIENETFSEDEIALRFSHRLVKIHLFPNGNGRHSRLIADILINKGFVKDEFTWGSINLTNIGNVRTTYLNALKKADEGDYKDLINFARS
ncbi:MAG: mobile mystery protein B [Melioribacteraceae bacterium]|nr:mobile mystery protein B [Melioribacteraceae bacterium]